MAPSKKLRDVWQKMHLFSSCICSYLEFDLTEQWVAFQPSATQNKALAERRTYTLGKSLAHRHKHGLNLLRGHSSMVHILFSPVFFGDN